MNYKTKINTILFFLMISLSMSAQQTLSKQETDAKFTSAIRKEFQIIFPIYKTISFKDKSGLHYFVFTESKDSIAGKDTLNKKIKGIALQDSKGKLKKEFELNDFASKSQNGGKESNIWFWTKYCMFSDLNKDSLAECIIVYSTSADNGVSDGKLKILIYHKGKKYAIRHENGLLDSQRNTQVDDLFYTLPSSIQNETKKLMQKTNDDTDVIFPSGWQDAMSKKKTKFSEYSK